VNSGGSSANKNDHWYIAKGTVCADRFPGVSGRWLRARFRIHAGPTANTHVVSPIRLNGRLIPQGARGTIRNLGHAWHTRLIALAGPGGWTTTADVFVPVSDDDLQIDKDLQIRITWNRSNRPDWNTTLYVPFNEPNCPGYADATGGGSGSGDGGLGGGVG
jgi:hypothetical protein